MAAHGHHKESSDPIDLLGDCSGCLPTRVAPLQKPPQRRRFRFETLAEPQPSSFSTRTEPWSGDMLEKARTAGGSHLSPGSRVSWDNILLPSAVKGTFWSSAGSRLLSDQPSRKPGSPRCL